MSCFVEWTEKDNNVVVDVADVDVVVVDVVVVLVVVDVDVMCIFQVKIR